MFSTKRKFCLVQILENELSGKGNFRQMYILASVNSGNIFLGKCNFGQMYILASVNSGE